MQEPKDTYHKVFKGIVQRGKDSMGWFFGFKLRLIRNGKDELLSFMLPPGDKDARRPLEYEAFIEAMDNGLKDISRVEHSRHRRFDNFIVRMLEAIATYCGSPTRPALF